MADYDALKTMLSSKTLDKATFKTHRDNLISCIETSPFGYAIYADATAHFLQIIVSDASYSKPPVTYLTQFIVTMHLHNVPMKDRNKIAKECIMSYHLNYV